MLDLILLPELRARMSRLGSQRASHFSWQKTARETLGVYYSVLEQRHTARNRAVPASLPQP
jgi:glycosyltransferase involved in cell wall biosynthesis